jgi:sugar lactone lactonase YvrE
MQRAGENAPFPRSRSNRIATPPRRHRRVIRAATEVLESRWLLSAASTSAIVADTFTNSGGPFGTTAYANGASIITATTQPDTANLPGGVYNYFTNSAGFPGGVISTSVGNPSLEIGPQCDLALPLTTPGAVLEVPNSLTVSVDFELNSIGGSDQVFRGMGIGFNATAPTGVNTNSNVIVNGVAVAPDGHLFFNETNGTANANITGGTYNASLLGPLTANQFYTLSYTIDITTGVVTNLNLSDSVGAETIASPGTLPGFNVNRTNAKFLVVSSSGQFASQFGYVDNLAVTAGPAPSVTTGPETQVLSGLATFSGTVNPNNSPTTVVTQYSTDPTFEPTLVTTFGPAFHVPTSVAVDAAGDVFETDGTTSSTVNEISNAGTVSQLPVTFNTPVSVTINAANDIYITDKGTSQVVELPTFVNAFALISSIPQPDGIAVDAAGNIFISSITNNNITKVVPSGTSTTYASGLHGKLAVDSAGNVYVAVAATSTIKKIIPNGTTGTVQNFGSGFSNPTGVAVDALGDVYVSDSNVASIKEILPNGSIRAIGSGLEDALDVAVDPGGNVYVADASNPHIVEFKVTMTSILGTQTGTTTVSFSGASASTVPGTQYYDRTVAFNSFGYVAAPAKSFVADLSPVTTINGTNSVSSTGAIVLATINPEFFSTTAEFQYSTDPMFPLTATVPFGPTFNQPEGVAADALGDIYVAEETGKTVKKIAPDGTTTPIASGLGAPFQIAVDPVGNLYIADLNNSVIDKIAVGGSLTPFATINFPTGVAVDPAGDVFAASAGSNSIEEILPNGVVKTIATGISGQLAVDSSGDLFVASSSSHTVKEFTPGGFALSIGSGFSTPDGVAVDAAGDVYVADNTTQTIKEVLPSGTIITVKSGLNNPQGLAFDSLGDLFYADHTTGQISQISAPTVLVPSSPINTGSVVSVALTGLTPATLYYFRAIAMGPGGTTTAASSFFTGLPPTLTTTTATGFSTSAAPGETINATVNPQALATTSRFQYSTDSSFPLATATTLGGTASFDPEGVAVDSVGNVYYTEKFFGTVDKVVPGASATVFASGLSDVSDTGPAGVAVDQAGNVYVSDIIDGTVKEFLPNGTLLKTVASGFSDPFQITVDSKGDVIVADSGDNAIKEVLPNGSIVTIGSGFNTPFGIAVDSIGRIYVSEFANGDIKRVHADGSIDTLATGLSGPLYLAVDANDDVFFTENDNKIKEILPSGTVNTINLGGFVTPRGIAVDGAGDVFVAFNGDIHGGGVQEFSPLTVAATPSSIGAAAGTTAVSATLTGLTPNTQYFYRVVGANVAGTVADSSPQSFTSIKALPGWFNITTGTASWDGTTLTMNGTGLIIGDPLPFGDHPNVIVQTGTLSVGLESASNLVHLNGLTINSGISSANFIINHTTGTHTTLIIASATNFVLGGNPINDLDLNNNFMIITGGGSQLPFFAEDISFFDAIVSSTVNSDRAAGNFQTSIGAIQNLSSTNTPIYTTFGGATVGSSDVLIRYTYLGDADLNGTVNSADYIQIDNGFNTSQGNANPGWYNGDFNYDHVIDGDDYTLIDNAFNTQGNVSVAAVPATPLAIDAAPTPSKQLALAVTTTTNNSTADDTFSHKKPRSSLIAELEQLDAK